MIRQTFRLFKWCLFVSLLSLIALVVSAPFYLYSRFNQETPVAKLTFRQLGEQAYVAQVRTGDFCEIQEKKILGDQWQVDASVVKWKGLAINLGFEPLYRLERISGRYRDASEQNTKQTLAHDLMPEVWFDLFDDKALAETNSQFVDTTFGSSVYLEIDVHKAYTVYMTEDALIAKSSNLPKVIDPDGIVTIEIDNACAKETDFIEVLAKKVNRLMVKLL